MKKILAAILCLTLASTAVLTSCNKKKEEEKKTKTAPAAEEYVEAEIVIPEEQKDYEVEVGSFGDDYVSGIRITGYLGEEKEVEVIKTAVDPETGDVLPVMAIGASAFLGNETIETVVLPETVVEIGNGAFESCPELRAVSLPAGLETIGGQAFFNSTKLEKLGKLLSEEEIEKLTAETQPEEQPEEVEEVEAPVETPAETEEVEAPADAAEVADVEEAEEADAEEKVLTLYDKIGTEFPETVKSIGLLAFHSELGIASPWFENLVAGEGNVILGDGILVKYKDPTVTEYTFDNPVKSIAYFAFKDLDGVNVKFTADLKEVSSEVLYNKTNTNMTVTLPTIFTETSVFTDKGATVVPYISFPREQHDYVIEFYTMTENEEGEEVVDTASVVTYNGEKENMEYTPATETSEEAAVPVAKIVKYNGSAEELEIIGTAVHPVLGVECEVVEIAADAFCENTTVKSVKIPVTVYDVAEGTFAEDVVLIEE